jgi:hypothetical protein
MKFLFILFAFAMPLVSAELQKKSPTGKLFIIHVLHDALPWNTGPIR